MMKRRSFLAGILAAGTAPALAKAGMLMPVKQIAPALPAWVGAEYMGNPHRHGLIDPGHTHPIDSYGPGAHTHSINDPGHTHDIRIGADYAIEPDTGTIMAFVGKRPAGWLPCNGAVVARGAYPKLAAHLGAPGDRVALPDLRGMFVRSAHVHLS